MTEARPDQASRASAPSSASPGAPAERQPLTGVSVLIVGAGTAGVWTALECWRKGHDVRILERSPSAYTMGDNYSIGASAVKAFRHWSGMLEENDRISTDPWLTTRKLNGEVITPPQSTLYSHDVDAPSRIHIHIRPKFQTMLLGYLARTGIEIQWNVHVKDYFENVVTGTGGVVLSGGQRIEADLVIAADGVGTKSHRSVTGQEVRAQSSGYSCYRSAFPIEHALADPIVAKRFVTQTNGHRVVEMWLGHEMHGMVQNSNDIISWTITRKVSTSNTAEESWSNAVDKEKVLEFTSTIPDWSEEMDRLIKLTPNAITDFQLVWRDPQDSWVSPGGRIVQIGDAAHTFLPSSGNGATQGIEDAVSLATCLQIGGRSNVPTAARIHNVLRRDRVSCAQLMGVVGQTGRHSFADTNKGIKQFKGTPKFGRWLWGHEPESYAYENYGTALRHLLEDTPFDNTNIPFGYSCKPWSISELIGNPEACEKVMEGGDWY